MLAIREIDESGSLRNTYRVHEDGSSKHHQKGSYTVEAAGLGRTVGLTRLLQSVFLPAGYPTSVSSDYSRYQILNALQAFCSSLAGLIASRAVLEGHGVGQAEASATNALLLTILQDIFSRITTIVSAYYLGTTLSPEAKTYRFLADIFNDIPLVLDTVSPILSSYSVDFAYSAYPPFIYPTLAHRPGSLRGVALCLSGAFRAICGVAAGGSKAALTLHFAQPDSGSALGDISDLSAKDGSKETVLALIGMLCGSAIMPYVQGQQMTYTLLVLLVAAHILINYLAVRAVTFRSLNRQRTSIVWGAFMDTAAKRPLMTPQRVAHEERIFANPSLLFGRGHPGTPEGIRGRCDMGSPLSTILPCRPGYSSNFGGVFLQRHACPWWTQDSENEWLPKLLELFKAEKYIIWFDAHSHRPSRPHLRVILKMGHTTRDHVKAWIHATELASLRDVAHVKGRTDAQTLLEDVRSSKDVIDTLVPRFMEYIQRAKWDIDAAAGGFITGSPMVIDTSSDDNASENKKTR